MVWVFGFRNPRAIVPNGSRSGVDSPPPINVADDYRRALGSRGD